MTRERVRQLAPEADIGNGATLEEVAAAERDLSFRFPADYREFLLSCDGLCGFVGPHYLILKSASVLGEYNKDYKVQEFCPEVVAIGTNGGNEMIVFRRDNGHVAFVPFVGMSIEEAVDVAPTFDGFLQHPRPPEWS